LPCAEAILLAAEAMIAAVMTGSIFRRQFVGVLVFIVFFWVVDFS
jgi:hypothetical protein